MAVSVPALKPLLSSGGQANRNEAGVWHLEIPAGSRGRYRLAQLDDYATLGRSAFPWEAPLTLKLRARASDESIPGTWGFGLWNDPFSLSLGFGGGTRRAPALPNAAWFFMAAPPNYLSLRDDLPARGKLAATFRSPHWPPPLLALAAPALPLFVLPPAARWLRRIGRRFVRQDAMAIRLDLTQWRAYELKWTSGCAIFSVDGEEVLNTDLAPRGPLGLVLWVDNQYAALPPNGRLGFGSLPNPAPAWVEIADLSISP